VDIPTTFRGALSPFWKLWRDDESLNIMEELFNVTVGELSDYSKALVDGVSVDSADASTPGIWFPLLLDVDKGAPLDRMVGEVVVGDFIIGDTDDPGRLWWPLDTDMVFDAVASSPLDGDASTEYEVSHGYINIPHDVLDKCSTTMVTVEGVLTDAYVVWLQNARNPLGGQLVLRHSAFAGRRFRRRVGMEAPVRAARTAWVSGMAGDAFKNIMDAACGDWEVLGPRPSQEELPYLSLLPGRLGPGYKGSLSFPNVWEPRRVQEWKGARIPWFTVYGNQGDVDLFRDALASGAGDDPWLGWDEPMVNPAWLMMDDTGVVVVRVSNLEWPELLDITGDTLPLGRMVVFHLDGAVEGSMGTPSMEASVHMTAAPGDGILGMDLVGVSARRAVFL